MFSITGTRIAGLVAVICAVVVAPQALAATSTHSKTTVVPPVDATMGNDLSGFDLSALNGIRGYQQQEEYLKGLAQSAIAADTRTSVKAASKAAAIEALQRRSVDLDAAYRKLYPGAYRQAVQRSNKAAVWRFPACGPSAAAEYDSYSGEPCIWTGGTTVGTILLAPAIESGVVSSSPVPGFCIGVGVPPSAVTIEYRPEEASGCEG